MSRAAIARQATCLHHYEMDSVSATHKETLLAKGAEPALPRLLATATRLVLMHTVVMLVHGAAHMRLNIKLSPWVAFYVLGIVGIGPIAGLLSLRWRRQRTGAIVLFTTMFGALLF